jgi:hypothetical protein
MAQDSAQLPPEQQRARDYFKPGGKFEKDNPGVRQRTHDAEMERRNKEQMRRGQGPRIEDTEQRGPRPGES